MRNAWISVRDSLPDADLIVLVYAPRATEPVWLGYWDGEAWFYVDAMPCLRTVTHWMPMPEPPAKRTESKK